MISPELGIIEGYYGKPWSFAARRDVVAKLAPIGYRFFLYAPKADQLLRRRWREDYCAEHAGELEAFAKFCKERNVRFGVGFSPYEIWRDFGPDTKEALARKLGFFDSIGVEQLAILFDDMRGDLPDLAAKQAEIMAWIAGRTGAARLAICPTYYTDDPVLDRYFGKRPARYLETLGAGLAPSIDMFWTGEEVCAREFSPGHLVRVAEQMGRKPLLWDNYPVNDGQRMSQFLHLRGFSGRPATIASTIAGHAINPALQPTLFCIPALTLADLYHEGEAYEYRASFERAAKRIAGAELGTAIVNDIYALQDMGLDRLGESAARLRARYSAFDSPAAREIIAWLDGAYRFEGELETQ